jgi:Arc/MetJ-type ribon-helix-helix transcriptional regulator
MVHNGRFASVDQAIAQAVRLLLQQVDLGQRRAQDANNGVAQHPILRYTREDAALMDEIVADAYCRRSEETWRELDL